MGSRTFPRPGWPDRRPPRATASAPCTIVDAHPKKEPGYAPYDTGLAGDHFVKNPDGSVYEAPVWPSQAEKNPGPSVFPDFSKPAAREWWGGLYKMFTDIGVAGIWNDMNEPAVFDTADRHDAARRATSTTTASRPTIARFTTSTAC